MDRRLRLTTVGEDVLSIVIGILHAESEHSLRQLSRASKYCKSLVDPVLFRTVVLTDTKEESKTTKLKVSRLLDPNDSLSHHVRDLEITDRNRVSEWNVNRDIPERLISILEQQWPSAKLSAENHDRKTTDRRILSSPLLQSLSFGIVNGLTDQLGHYSKLAEVKEILSMVPHLRKLNVRFKYNWSRRQVEWMGFTASPHICDQHPLLPLSGPDETYECAGGNCQLKIQCNDWSRPQGFAVRISYPNHLFDDMWDCVHQKPLTVEDVEEPREEEWRTYASRTGKDMYTVIDFIEPSSSSSSSPKKEDLDPTASKIASTISETQTRFQSLLSRAPKVPSRYYAWTPEQLLSLYEQGIELRHFKIEVPWKWPNHYAETLARLNRVREVTVFVFHDDIPPQVAVALFKRFFEHDPNAALRSLEVRFWHEDRSIMVRRGEGGYTVDVGM